jgi:hypothetical protein
MAKQGLLSLLPRIIVAKGSVAAQIGVGADLRQTP